MGKIKGQFLVISAILASMTTLTLTATITEIQNQKYQPETIQNDVNQIKTEIKKITKDNTITTQEEKNFKKMMSYYKNYATQTQIKTGTNPCIKVKIEKPGKKISLPCIN